MKEGEDAEHHGRNCWCSCNAMPALNADDLDAGHCLDAARSHHIAETLLKVATYLQVLWGSEDGGQLQGTDVGLSSKGLLP